MRLSQVLQQTMCQEIGVDLRLRSYALYLHDLAAPLNAGKRGCQESFFAEYMRPCSQKLRVQRP